MSDKQLQLEMKHLSPEEFERLINHHPVSRGLKASPALDLTKPFRRLAPTTAAPEIDQGTGKATFIFNTEEVGRDGHIVLNRGIQTQNYAANPVILFAHDDSQPPVGRGAVRIGETASKVDVEFTPRDLYPFGATVGELVRGGYLNACSMSWQPIEWHFMDDRSGVIFDAVDMLEISIVPVPALPDAIATARARGIDTGPLREWAERILDLDGMQSVPRTELETLRRAAKMPTKTSRRSGTTPEETLKAKHARALARAPKVPTFKRGLYEVAGLCYLLSQLGYCHESSEYEAALEGDDSEVPEMLGEALVQLGEALKSMATEEVNELLEAHGPDDDGDEDDDEDVVARALPAKTRAHIAAAKSPRARAWRTGIALARAENTLSPTNEDLLDSASEHHERAMKHHKAMADAHRSVSEHLASADERCERATSTLSELGEHVRAAQENPAESSDHLAAAAKKHAQATKEVGEVAKAHDDAGDAQDDADDAHQAMGRCVKRAQRCVRAVVKGSAVDDSEPDSKDADDIEDEEAAAKAKDAEERAARARRARALQLQADPVAA